MKAQKLLHAIAELPKNVERSAIRRQLDPRRRETFRPILDPEGRLYGAMIAFATRQLDKPRLAALLRELAELPKR
jgi:hypothetical protein